MIVTNAARISSEIQTPYPIYTRQKKSNNTRPMKNPKTNKIPMKIKCIKYIILTFLYHNSIIEMIKTQYHVPDTIC